ncbi:MAG: hydrogenase maturation nickel metallochaperone HypA [Deltaproteobacteria bacterium]|jgi:hydrogenase nickel incorporation protein HypA/HybF|nr:hydrogenase maturation nickel metallochaperone HypA [Deltaproteobacteria bacterium]
MHELSLAAGLLELVRDELARHGAGRLLRARVRYGALSNVLPEALDLAFSSLLRGGPHAGAVLELVEEPLLLRCGSCGEDFTPPEPVLFVPCPHCGQEFFHSVRKGRELYLDHLEAD